MPCPANMLGVIPAIHRNEKGEFLINRRLRVKNPAPAYKNVIPSAVSRAFAFARSAGTRSRGISLRLTDSARRGVPPLRPRKLLDQLPITPFRRPPRRLLRRGTNTSCPANVLGYFLTIRLVFIWSAGAYSRCLPSGLARTCCTMPAMPPSFRAQRTAPSSRSSRFRTNAPGKPSRNLFAFRRARHAVPVEGRGFIPAINDGAKRLPLRCLSCSM